MGRVGSNHEPRATARPRGRVGKKPSGEPQHRTSSELLNRPVQPGQRASERDARNPTEAGAVKGAAAAGNSMFLPWEVCMGPFRTVGWEKVSDDRPTPMQKSDLSIIAMKPVKAGGAKGGMD